MDIAILGVAGRFPGARDVGRLWKNLRAGTESIARLDRARLLAEGLGEKLVTAEDYVPVAPVLDDHDLFDARFFGFGAREAALLDPQHRLFLECAWHAMENAGVPPAGVRSGGVFAAANLPGYLLSNLLGGRRAILDGEWFELQIHNDKDYLAARVAHRLGFTGPAVSVQTACSSSLVAVHTAAKALAEGQCGLAIAGGVCVRVPHHVGYRHEPGMVFSADGHCRPFDADASGTVFGSGVGAVVLRRLSDAVADGNRVLAVLKGSAVNNDGSAKVGFTAPSVAGQEAAVRAALDAAGVDPETITALEAHGTATPVGDPIEITALTRAFATGRTGFCTIGSIKANIGHLESAAGIAGFIKAVLQLRHATLAPMPHFCRPNPAIDFGATPFVVRTDATPWQPEGCPRRIGVSAFGIGGTNAHVILEQAPDTPATAEADVPRLVVVTGKTRTAADRAASDLAQVLDGPRPPRPQDVARTLRTGRERFRFRRAAVLRSGADRGAVSTLAAAGRTVRSGPVRTVWLFPGQGSQYPGMGAQLYATLPGYAAVVDECTELLSGSLGAHVRAALLDRDFDAARLRRTELAQPALFVAEYALARQLQEWGCAPATMVGHSLGEVVAACLAEVFDLPGALRLVAERGALMAVRPPGVMLAVRAGEETVAAMLPASVSIAAVNAPELCVVAGPGEQARRCGAELAAAGHAVSELHTSHAFHSAMMDPVAGPLGAVVAELPRRPPHHPFVSAVTGATAGSEVTEPAYWARHARQPVRFADALRTAVDGEPDPLLIEIGPGRTLGTFAGATFGARVTAVPAMPRPGGSEPGLEVLLTAMARLWERGGPVDLAALPGAEGDLVDLPGYPFARERYWIGPEPGEPAASRPASPAAAPAPEVDRPAGLSVEYVEPDTNAQRRIIQVWEEVLQYRPIGVRDDFFELGGHSLLASQLSARLTEVTGVRCSLRDVMTRPTPAALAELVETTTRA